MHKAKYWDKGEKNRVQCKLCPQLCVIGEEKKGFCRVRANENGQLFTLNYGRCSSYGIDPIEKKPLYHFYPGTNIFSVGTVGCNLRCGFCQNWSIAHGEPETVEISPARLVEVAEREQENGSIGIAYTYSEPLMWYEFVLDTAKLMHAKGLKNVLVTNGFINHEPFAELLPYIDAMNIDVKAFRDDFYNTTCAGELHPVKETVERVFDKCHVEITTLLVTGLNDGPDEIEELTDWLASLSPDIPLHLSRYFPNYKMDLPATPLENMELARAIALKKLNYVYVGNVQDDEGRNTYCPECKELLIDRSRYQGTLKGLRDGKCSKCGKAISVVGAKL